MKYTATLLAIALLASIQQATASSPQAEVKVYNLTTQKKKDSIAIQFHYQIPTTKPARGYNRLILQPIIYNQKGTQRLAKEYFDGRLRRILIKRQQEFHEASDPIIEGRGLSAKRTYIYTTTIKYQKWMEELNLQVISVVLTRQGAYISNQYPDLQPINPNKIVSRNQPEVEEPEADTTQVETPPSITHQLQTPQAEPQQALISQQTEKQEKAQEPLRAEVTKQQQICQLVVNSKPMLKSLSATPVRTLNERFVELAGMLNGLPKPQEAVKASGLEVRYRLGKNRIESDYATNAQALDRLVSAIRTIKSDRSVQIAGAAIAAVASPDGLSSSNYEMAKARASSLAAILAREAAIPLETIQTYAEGESWEAIKEAVRSCNFANSTKILRAINAGNKGIDKERRIIEIDGGATYRKLMDEVFSKLPNSAYVMLYFKPVVDLAGVAINEAAVLIGSDRYAEALMRLKPFKNDERVALPLALCYLYLGQHAEGLALLNRAASQSVDAAKLLAEVELVVSPKVM